MELKFTITPSAKIGSLKLRLYSDNLREFSTDYCHAMNNLQRKDLLFESEEFHHYNSSIIYYTVQLRNGEYLPDKYKLSSLVMPSTIEQVIAWTDCQFDKQSGLKISWVMEYEPMSFDELTAFSRKLSVYEQNVNDLVSGVVIKNKNSNQDVLYACEGTSVNSVRGLDATSVGIAALMKVEVDASNQEQKELFRNVLVSRDFVLGEVWNAVTDLK